MAKVCSVCCKFRAPDPAADTAMDCPIDGNQTTVDACPYCGGLVAGDPLTESEHGSYDFTHSFNWAAVYE